MCADGKSLLSFRVKTMTGRHPTGFEYLVGGGKHQADVPCRGVARELIQLVRNNATIDWTLKEQAPLAATRLSG